MRFSKDRGETWSDDLFTREGVIPTVALAVAPSGTLGLLYQRLGTEFQPWRRDTHFQQIMVKNHVEPLGNWQSMWLASVPADPQFKIATPVPQFEPYIGDYIGLVAVKDEFRGVFSANNYPDKADFPQGVIYQRHVDWLNHKLKDAQGNDVDISIDPFFFRVSVL